MDLLEAFKSERDRALEDAESAGRVCAKLEQLASIAAAGSGNSNVYTQLRTRFAKGLTVTSINAILTVLSSAWTAHLQSFRVGGFVTSADIALVRSLVEWNRRDEFDELVFYKLVRMLLEQCYSAEQFSVVNAAADYIVLLLNQAGITTRSHANAFDAANTLGRAHCNDANFNAIFALFDDALYHRASRDS